MTGIETIAITRALDGVPLPLICEIDPLDLEFLRIGSADIGLSVEHLKRGIVISLSRVKIYPRARGTQIEVTRSPRGDIRRARLVIDPEDLQCGDLDVESLERTVTRVAGELIVRFTAKTCSDEVGS